MLIPAAFKQVVGMNRRNRDFVLRFNSRKAVRMAKDKIASKAALRAHGIPTPRLIATLHAANALEQIYPALVCEEGGFVVKPAHGAQGKGIQIFLRALPEGTLLPYHGDPISIREFRFALASIISGEYSSGVPEETVLIEERIRLSAAWVYHDLPGPPDMRVIVHRGKAVMAMLRIPTIASGGKANLHQGGVGVGIDLAEKTVKHAVWKGRAATHHPDTGQPLIGAVVEHFDECIRIAERCFDAVPLGYMGVDLMLDAETGPLVIEVNSHPGLAIQIANGRGLRPPLDALRTVAP